VVGKRAGPSGATWDTAFLERLSRRDDAAWQVVWETLTSLARRARRKYRLTPSEHDEVRGDAVLAVASGNAEVARRCKEPRLFGRILAKIVFRQARRVAGRSSQQSLACDVLGEGDLSRLARTSRSENRVFPVLEDLVLALEPRLTELQYRVVWRRCVEGETWGEVARALGTTPGAAKRAFDRALESLRRGGGAYGAYPPPYLKG